MGEYDFLVWASFPSSVKLVNKTGRPDLWTWWGLSRAIPILPGHKLKTEVKIKQNNVNYSVSHVHFDGFDGKNWRFLSEFSVRAPLGSFDWGTFSKEVTIPSDIVAIRHNLGGGSGSEAMLGVAWFDDLKIYQDGVLIYENKFSNWTPVIISTGIATAEIITGVAMIKFIK